MTDDDHVWISALVSAVSEFELVANLHSIFSVWLVADDVLVGLQRIDSRLESNYIVVDLTNHIAESLDLVFGRDLILATTNKLDDDVCHLFLCLADRVTFRILLTCVVGDSLLDL